jgi:uncharacterized protein (DUF1778 family)
VRKRKPKLGRPALPANEKRQVFALRLSADEREMIERAAEDAGQRVSDWARDALLRAAGASAVDADVARPATRQDVINRDSSSASDD